MKHLEGLITNISHDVPCVLQILPKRIDDLSANRLSSPTNPGARSRLRWKPTDIFGCQLFILVVCPRNRRIFVPACTLSSAAWSIFKIWNSRYCRAIQRMALMQTLHNAVLPTPVGRFPQHPGLTPIPRALSWLSTLSRVLNSAVLGPNAPCVHYSTGTAPIFRITEVGKVDIGCVLFTYQL